MLLCAIHIIFTFASIDTKTEEYGRNITKKER